MEVGSSDRALWVTARRPRRAFTLLICTEEGQDLAGLTQDIHTSPQLQKLWPKVFQTPLDQVRVHPSSVSFEGVLRRSSPDPLREIIDALVDLTSAHAPLLNRHCWRCDGTGPTEVVLHGRQVLLACAACAPAPVDRTRQRRDMVLACAAPVLVAVIAVHWWTDLLTMPWIRKVAKLALIASPFLIWGWWRWVRVLRNRWSAGVAHEDP
jgi:hypothetical protein